MPQSFAYILNTRPFRENSLLVDLFTEEAGKIFCVARPAKKRGKVVKGTLQPFRYLDIQWIGKGDVQTLTDVDERGRHTIPPSELMMGLYLNELILLLTHQHSPMPALFSAYKYTLHKLNDPVVNRQIMMRFEVYLLAELGHNLNISEYKSDHYRFTEDQGLISAPSNNMQTKNSMETKNNDAIISTELLLALQNIQNMTESQWHELRRFLDATFTLITPRKINTRRLLNI